jgi:hypothetical protein
VTPAARREYVHAVRLHYTLAPKRAKPRMLDESCVTTGYHRKYATTLLMASRTVVRLTPSVFAKSSCEGNWEPGISWSLRMRSLSRVPAASSFVPLRSAPLSAISSPGAISSGRLRTDSTSTARSRG